MFMLPTITQGCAFLQDYKVKCFPLPVVYQIYVKWEPYLYLVEGARHFYTAALILKIGFKS